MLPDTFARNFQAAVVRDAYTLPLPLRELLCDWPFNDPLNPTLNTQKFHGSLACGSGGAPCDGEVTDHQVAAETGPEHVPGEAHLEHARQFLAQFVAARSALRVVLELVIHAGEFLGPDVLERDLIAAGSGRKRGRDDVHLRGGAIADVVDPGELRSGDS